MPATAQFSYSTPMLVPRVKRLGSIRPFMFMTTARYLEPAATTEGWRSDLLPFSSATDTAARDALMELSDQGSWGSVVDTFAEHKDRKCERDSEGRVVRRHVLVRRSRTEGIGKEANRIETARILGVGPTGARAKVYEPFIQRILALPLDWGPKNGIPRASFARLRKALRSGRIPRGHGTSAMGRVQLALAGNLASGPRT